MTSIIRSSDKNKIKVILLKENKIIRKITENKNLQIYIKREHNGLNWYSSKLKKKSKELISKYNCNSINSFIDLKIYNGKKNIFYHSIVKNENILLMSISHYKKIWPKKKKTFCHGDLTVDNILCNKDKIRFIDWELSGLSEEIWGFDLVYLVISSIFFPYNEKKFLNENEKKVFTKLWNKLHDLKISKNLLSKPLDYYIKTYKKIYWKKATKDHPKKLFPKFVDQNFKDILENLIK